MDTDTRLYRVKVREWSAQSPTCKDGVHYILQMENEEQRARRLERTAAVP